MAARSGMTDLITRLRSMVDDVAMSIWTDDDHLEDVLDLHKVRVYREKLEMERTLLSSTEVEYTVYHSRYGDYEAGGTAYFQIEGAGGSQRGTADYTVDYINGVIAMTADQAGSALYLTGWSYDLSGGAVDLWRERAGQVAGRYDVVVGSQRLSRSQHMKHCLDMAEHYMRQMRAKTVRSWRHGVFDDE